MGCSVLQCALLCINKDDIQVYNTCTVIVDVKRIARYCEKTEKHIWVCECEQLLCADSRFSGLLCTLEEH